MKWYYFVSYNFSNGDSTKGFGMREIILDYPIKHFAQIRLIADEIATKLRDEGMKKTSVVVIYYSLLRHE